MSILVAITGSTGIKAGLNKIQNLDKYLSSMQTLLVILPGREQHRLSVYRTIRQLWRLVYPSNIECIGFDENIVSPYNKPIISLRTGEQFNNFPDYYNSLDISSNSREEWELRLIALIDAEQIDLLLNRKGNINTASYPPYCMYLDTFNKLSQEQRLSLMPFISTPPTIIKE